MAQVHQEVIYNGFSFQLSTVGFGGQAVYDQLDRTLQGHNITFRVEGWIVGTDDEDYENKLKDFYSRMAQSRREFKWTLPGGVIAWHVGAAGSGTPLEDRRKGPHPRIVEINQVTGGLSSRVRVEIECFLNVCDNYADIEEFWWGFNYQYDRNFTCTREITGHFRVRSGIDGPLTLANNTDLWPPLPKGFYRESVSHETSGDGLQITFRVTDRQIWRTLPKPLTNGEATLKVEQQGAKLIKTLTCSFEAPHDVNKQVIMQFITELVRARFPNAINPVLDDNASGQLQEFIYQFSVTNYEFENRMDVTVSSRSGAQELRNAGNDNSIAMPDAIFGDVADVTPESEDDWTASNGFSELRGSTGTAGLLPQANTPFDVCVSRTTPAETGKNADDPGTNEQSEEGSGTFEPGPGLSGPEQQSNTSAEHKRAPYNSYIENYQFILDRNIKFLPKTIESFGDDNISSHIVQQTAPPTMKIIQIGYARRIGIPPRAPNPAPLVSGEAYMERQEVRPEAPQMIGDGRTVEHSLGWTYVFTVVDVHGFKDDEDTAEELTDAEQLSIKRPRNPQLSTLGEYKNAEPIDFHPDSITPPDGKV